MYLKTLIELPRRNLASSNNNENSAHGSSYFFYFANRRMCQNVTFVHVCTVCIILKLSPASYSWGYFFLAILELLMEELSQNACKSSMSRFVECSMSLEVNIKGIFFKLARLTILLFGGHLCEPWGLCQCGYLES